MLQEGEGGKKWEGQMDGQAKRQKRKDGREGKGERRGRGAVQWDGKLVREMNDWTKEERWQGGEGRERWLINEIGS